MSHQQTRFELLVPAYFYPAAQGLVYWNQLIEAAARVPIVAIMNPASGPGTELDPLYRAVLERARSSGVRVIAYVASGYGARPMAEVCADLLRYQSFYPLDGFFIDEMATDAQAASLEYYGAVYACAKSLDARYRVIGNPGVAAHESFLSHPAADALVVFEKDANAYQAIVAQRWVSKRASAQIGHLVYQVGNLRAARRMLDIAAQHNAGLVYFTDDTLDNPWDSLPSYWDGLVDEINKRNRIAGSV
jgi:Spherulation-specific family 4